MDRYIISVTLDAVAYGNNAQEARINANKAFFHEVFDKEGCIGYTFKSATLVDENNMPIAEKK